MAPSGPLVMNAVLRKSIPYSPQKDFVPISVLGRLPLLITVNASLPVHSVKQLVEYAKARPNDVTDTSSAPLFLLATELFKQKTGTSFLAIPYKSSGESTNALMGVEPVGNTSEEYARAIKTDTERWAEVGKRANIQPE